MTQYERMIKGLIYDPADSEILNEQMSFGGVMKTTVVPIKQS